MYFSFEDVATDTFLCFISYPTEKVVRVSELSLYGLVTIEIISTFSGYCFCSMQSAVTGKPTSVLSSFSDCMLPYVTEKSR